MRVPYDHRIRRGLVAGALGALGVAIIAMLTLHIVAPELNPAKEPVSFYVHAEYGWLLIAALGSFGAAAGAVALLVRDTQSSCVASSLFILSAGMLLAAFVPSDHWFPWEATPTAAGLVHAITAVISPPLLLLPMLTFKGRLSGYGKRFNIVLIILYTGGLISSVLSLGIGFIMDGPPPFIGLAERALAVGGVCWLASTAIAIRHAANSTTSRKQQP